MTQREDRFANGKSEALIGTIDAASVRLCQAFGAPKQASLPIPKVRVDADNDRPD